ncbi:hypothetical protein OG21DRAFT_608406 [Imleria badia]|nr:hypothetical protein OG21DRAFT_608406 [Imleria badia]
MASLQNVAKAPFLHFPECKLVFDTRTRTFYEFPEFLVALVKTRYQTGGFAPDRIVLTSTHVIALYTNFPCPVTGTATLLQAFIVDGSSVRNGKGVLRRSHEGVSNHDFDHVALLRNSIVDPITESTNVRLLGCVGFIHDLHVLWGDLTLPKPSGNEVLPITIAIHKEVEKPKPEKPYGWGGVWNFDCSDAGLLRGFKFYRASSFQDPQHPSGLVKFTLDATRDECTFAVGNFLPPEWNHIKDPIGRKYGKYITSFDASGRLCLVKYIDMDDPELVVVVDIE